MTALKVLRPVRLRIHGEARTWKAGEVLTLDPAQAEAVKSSPLASAFRPLSPAEVREHNDRARADLDDHFRDRIVPALTALSRAGRLPADGLSSPEWREVEAAWQEANEDSPAPCDVEKVKALMAAFVEGRGGRPNPPVPAPPRREEVPVRAVTIRHGRTGQEAVILSTVLDSWLSDGWEVKGGQPAHDVAPGEAIEARPDAEHGPKAERGGEA